MKFSITWDASVAAAPAAFKSAVVAAAQYYANAFSDNVTVNLSIGYGEVNGQSLGASALGASVTNFQSSTYSELTSALRAHATSATDALAVASLASTDPTGGAKSWVTTAQAKALGLTQAAGPAVDGYIGFSSSASFAYTSANGVPPGAYDFMGVALHEISEVMGRSLLAGESLGGSSRNFGALDLMHYSGVGVRDLSATTPGYFSVDGGKTALSAFNTNPNGDAGDWAASAGNDAYLAFSKPGVVNAAGSVDLKVMDAIGWTLASSAAPTGSPIAPAPAPVTAPTSPAPPPLAPSAPTIPGFPGLPAHPTFNDLLAWIAHLPGFSPLPPLPASPTHSAFPLLPSPFSVGVVGHTEYASLTEHYTRG